MNAPVIAVFCVLAALLPVTEDTWPAFRGDGANHTPARDLPLHWSPEENIAWTAAIRGYGQSSPVIWNDRAFVTSVEGAEKETCIVTAFDLATGEARWQQTFDAAQRIEMSNAVSKGAPSPVVDARGVYAFFESGDLIALSHAGEILWRRNLVADYGVTHMRHGLGSSLAHTADAVYVLIEQAAPSLLIAFDKADGAERWQAARNGSTAWTSPVVAEMGGRETILISSDTSLSQYDAESGALIQALDTLSGISIPSPAVSGEMVVVGANSRRPSQAERTPERSNCAVRLPDSPGAPIEMVWEGDGAQADYASPLIHQGNVYFVTARGDVQCRDLETGAVHYTERAHPCWATPIAAGDRIYLFGKYGDVTVIAAGDAFEVLARNRLWPTPEGDEANAEPAEEDPRSPNYTPKVTVYAAAAVNRTFLARTGNTLFAIRKPAE